MISCSGPTMDIARARRSYRIGLIPVLCGLFAATVAVAPKEFSPAGAAQKGSGVTRSTFGKTPDGATVDLFTLTNSHGAEIRVITYGGIIVSIRVPDKNGRMDDVVLGFDDFAGTCPASPPISAPSWGDMPTGSVEGSFRSTEGFTSWRRTTVKTTCMGA